MSQDARNYYDEQFNKRISEIAKPGARSPSWGSTSSWGAKGFGGVIVVVILFGIRVLVGLGSSSTYSTPSYEYTPPSYSVPPPQIDFPQQNEIPNNQWKNEENNNENLQKMLKQLRAKQLEKERIEELQNEDLQKLLQQLEAKDKEKE